METYCIIDMQGENIMLLTGVHSEVNECLCPCPFLIYLFFLLFFFFHVLLSRSNSAPLYRVFLLYFPVSLSSVISATFVQFGI